MGVAGRSKPGVDDGSGLVLSCVSFGDTWFGNLESAGPVERDQLGD